MTSLLQHENSIRLGTFVCVFVVMAIIEHLAPRRKLHVNKQKRWFTNFGLVIVDTITLRLIMPFAAIAVASISVEKGWGIFAFTPLPVWLEIIFAIILLDLLIYAQHVASHKIPLLWRVHKVHHVDRDLDVTSGFRFHPIEIILSMLFKFLCIIALGAPVIAIFLFEVILNASAMFNHSNIKLAISVDSKLRNVIMTPDAHRVHHSAIQQETDTNYGFFLSCWDKLFNTYHAQPKLGHDKMTIGLGEHQTEQPSSLLWCLALPFQSNKPPK